MCRVDPPNLMNRTTDNTQRTPFMIMPILKNIVEFSFRIYSFEVPNYNIFPAYLFRHCLHPIKRMQNILSRLTFYKISPEQHLEIHALIVPAQNSE